MGWKPLTRLLSLGSSKSIASGSDSTLTDSSTATSGPSHTNSDDHPVTSAASAVCRPEAKGLQLDVGNGGTGTGHGPAANSIPVEATPSSCEDKVDGFQRPEVDISSTFKATPKPSSKNGDDKLELENRYGLLTLQPVVKKEPFTKNHDLMDDMLDGVLMMRSFIVYKDKANNAEAAAKARAEGVKVHDFAANPASQDLAAAHRNSTLFVQDNPAVELFRVHEKALEFFYMRFLVNNGVYDLPHYPLTVEDVDRLYTCGVIGPDDLDNILLCSMMGHGTYRRLRRSSGTPTFNGDILPPRGQWTILGDHRRPTKEEVYRYISLNESSRFSRRYAINMYRIAAFERPLMSEEYVLHRIQRDGFWGLKRMAGIDDDKAIKLFTEKDMTFIPPKTFLEKSHELFSRPKATVPASPQPGPSFATAASSHGSESSTSSFTQASHPSADVPQPSPSSAVAASSELPELSLSSNTASLPSTPVRGRSAVSKGKKRARSPSAISEQDDSGSVRRTRARLSSQSPSASSSSDASPCSERVLRRSTKRITERVPLPEDSPLHSHSPAPASSSSPSSSKGKKRARDDEPESEVLDDSSPTKKVKAADGVTLADPATVGSSKSPPAEPDVATATPAAAEPTNPPPVDRPPPRPLKRQSAMLFDRVTGKFVDFSTNGVPCERLPDTEQGNFFARFDHVRVPSWAELCARPKPPAPTPNPKSEVLEVAQPQPKSELPEVAQPQPQLEVPEVTQSQPQPEVPEVVQPPSQPPRRRGLTRQHMRYLDEVFPQYHPRFYGTALVRQPMRYLDEVLPDLFPPWVPTEEKM